MRPVPTRRLALVAALAALVVLAWPGDGLAPLLWVNGVLLLAALLDALLAVDPRSLEIHRDLPAVVTLGAEAEIRWSIRNPTDRQLRASLADELAPSLLAQTRRVHGRVPPSGRLVTVATMRPSRRGRFEIEELVVRVDGPLGLAARQRTLALSSVLRVHPPFHSRAEAELRIDKARILEVGLRSAKGRGTGTEFDQLREYGVDDEVRRIDWAATARSGRAMVRTYRAERNQTVILMLDSGRAMAGQVAGVPRMEHAIDAVMCVTTVATRLGDRCGLLVFDDEVRSVVPASSSQGQLGRVSEAMYALEPVLAESDYAGAFATTLVRFRRRSLIVVLTDLVEQAIGESLLPALPLLSQHHIVLVGAVRDPDVVRWATDAPGDDVEAYRSVAAVAALQDRDRAIARLRRRGAVVVDAPPGELAPRLTDAYLDMKARGRL